MLDSHLELRRPGGERTTSSESTDTQATMVTEDVPNSLNMLRNAGLDFGELPLQFLEYVAYNLTLLNFNSRRQEPWLTLPISQSYPYPALVLVP